MFWLLTSKKLEENNKAKLTNNWYFTSYYNSVVGQTRPIRDFTRHICASMTGISFFKINNVKRKYSF